MLSTRRSWRPIDGRRTRHALLGRGELADSRRDVAPPRAPPPSNVAAAAVPGAGWRDRHASFSALELDPLGKSILLQIPRPCHHRRPPFNPLRAVRAVPTRRAFFSPSVAERLESALPPASPFLSDFTVWGATGFLLANFHAHLHLPYWACISLANVCIRSAMIPVSVRGAKAQVRFGAVSPEVQYLITKFTMDMKELKARGQWSRKGSFAWEQSLRGQGLVIRSTWASLRGVFKLYKVNLLDIFKSPALQIPFFWYFAVDLRRIIEGSDPALAQQLVDSSFLWITDLTDPDPWYGLPIFTGALLYLNVEVAVGRRALGGEASSKSNMQVLLKDVFQTLAVFMPCFMAQQPSGVQLYLATSMLFTLLQARAMRADTVRELLALPRVSVKPKGQGEFLKEFVERMAERQAAKARGGFIVGEGVHRYGANVSHFRTGRMIKSSIVAEKKGAGAFGGKTMIKLELPVHTLRGGPLVFPEMFRATPVPFLPGMAEPVFHDATCSAASAVTGGASPSPDVAPQSMEAANRGEMPKRPVEMAPRGVLARREQARRLGSKTIDASRMKSKWNRRKGKRGKR